MSSLTAFLLVGFGGALGAAARYGIGLALLRTAPGLPLATWAVNVGGSFLIGLAVPLLLVRGGAADAATDAARLALVVGFLGSFTTFSTFSLDTLALWEGGRAGWALANAGGSVVLGLVAVALGAWLGRALV